jgi:uncharacterized membrane protein YkoI
MWSSTRCTLIGISLAVAGLSLASHARPAHASPAADRDHAEPDHDHARRAVERGEALPLSDILARVRPELGGEVIVVAFRRKTGRWVYEFRVIAAAGRLEEVYVDAATAQVLKRESH